MLITQLNNTDGLTYAVAQGQLAVSGFSVQGQAETLTQACLRPAASRTVRWWNGRFPASSAT